MFIVLLLRLPRPPKYPKSRPILLACWGIKAILLGTLEVFRSFFRVLVLGLYKAADPPDESSKLHGGPEHTKQHPASSQVYRNRHVCIY